MARIHANLGPMRIVGALVLAVGMLVLAVGLIKKTSLPPEPSSQAFLSGEASFDEVSDFRERSFSATSWMMFGGFVTFTGLAMLITASRRFRAMSNALTAERAAALSHGFREGWSTPDSGVEERLAALERLRDRGHINQDEYDAKRASILASL